MFLFLIGGPILPHSLNVDVVILFFQLSYISSSLQLFFVYFYPTCHRLILIPVFFQLRAYSARERALQHVGRCPVRSAVVSEAGVAQSKVSLGHVLNLSMLKSLLVCIVILSLSSH